MRDDWVDTFWIYSEGSSRRLETNKKIRYVDDSIVCESRSLRSIYCVRFNNARIIYETALQWGLILPVRRELVRGLSCRVSHVVGLVGR